MIAGFFAAGGRIHRGRCRWLILAHDIGRIATLPLPGAEG